MQDFLSHWEGALRLGFFLAVLAAMAAWECLAPCRRPGLPRRLRWPGNLGLAALDTLLVRLAFPLAATGMALTAQDRGWGFLHRIDAPAWAEFALAFLLLDLAIYLQHVLFHSVPAFWRIHRMHHADTDFDASTGIRFHPLEILISMVLKLGCVAALGPPVMAVLAFEIVLNATALFNHGNVHLPARLDRALRWLVVTPDMHRVHHSVRPEETHSNFGFNLPWWDRMLGTYRPRPHDPHATMTLGLTPFRDPAEARLDRLLLQPFRPYTSEASASQAGPRA